MVDVAARTVGIPSAGITEPFELADFAQWRLLEGLDDIALTLRHEAAISAYEGSRAAWLPTLAANAPATRLKCAIVIQTRDGRRCPYG